MWYGLELEKVDHAQTYFVLPLLRSRDAPYFGMTVEPIPPSSRVKHVRHHGLVFKKIGLELEHSVHFALRKTAKLNGDILAHLREDYRSAPPPRRDRKQYAVRQLAESLVGRLFPNKPAETKETHVGLRIRTRPRSDLGLGHPGTVGNTLSGRATTKRPKIRSHLRRRLA
jgi:hypothetical protein